MEHRFVPWELTILHIIAVQRHDKRAIFIRTFCCWHIGILPGYYIAPERQCNKEGQRYALVGQVPIIQDGHEKRRVLFSSFQSEQVLPICVMLEHVTLRGLLSFCPHLSH